MSYTVENDACGFEDALRAVNALYYESQDGSRRPAGAGAYMSIIDYPEAEKILDTYPIKKVQWLEDYYNSMNYLSPGFGLIAIACKYNRRRRMKCFKCEDPLITKKERWHYEEKIYCHECYQIARGRVK